MFNLQLTYNEEKKPVLLDPLLFERNRGEFAELFEEGDVKDPESFVKRVGALAGGESGYDVEGPVRYEESSEEDSGPESGENDPPCTNNGVEDDPPCTNDGIEGDPVPSPKKRRRRAGELSGRQLAIQKLNKESKKNLSTHYEENKEWPPPFLSTVKSMRKVLLEFSEGEEEVFSDEEASAMRVYFTRKFNVSGKVSLGIQ